MSVIVTYGKRRNKNILRTLGSRRQNSTVDHSPSDQLISEPSNKDPTKRASRKTAMPGPQTIEEMASWLLDDSTLGSPENAEEDYSPNKRRATTPSISLSNDCPAISPLDLPSPIKTPPKQSDKYPQSSRVSKLSPRKSPGRVPRRSATTRIRRDKSQRRTSANLQRHLGPTRTLSLDPFKFHPASNCKDSTSVPLAAVDKNVRNPVTEKPNIPNVHEECAGGEEINGKLVAMLAATNSLKPSPQRANSSSSRFTRMMPTKVLTKVSNAWDRFHPKPSAHEKKPKPPFGDEEGEELAWQAFAPSCPPIEGMSPISVIELRLNEGDNLNKRKVQRIVGGRINRKPLADDGNSLRNGKLTEDPFAERGGWRKPTTFETRLKSGASDSERGTLPLPCNPFETEKGFDNNIEDRFLNSTPVGSSTPRIRVEQASTSISEYSSTPSTLSLSQKRLSANVNDPPLNSGKEMLGSSSRSNHMLAEPGHGSWVDSITQARQAWERAAGELNAFDSNRMKKHPSPSKETLEKLEIEFRHFADVQVTATVKHGADELSANFIAPSPSSITYERKRVGLARLSVTHIDELSVPLYDGVHHRRGSSTSMIQLLRGPCTIQDPTKLHKDIRLTVPYRPTGVSPFDTDELH
ncbi:hypothetical protein BKA59DRAFT_550598 [Fusarium tricinctum]|uniref:Uncharacterized protein n=1 Tax=Fusarium tricinctum TaxID=61284 RepID=A0A8K0SCR2_9HYPO|nr:hypothetical protein BKA59DRAFT_550598 [Fusarium tricinctum]